MSYRQNPKRGWLCLECGKFFYRDLTNNEVKKGKGYYCSKSCATFVKNRNRPKPDYISLFWKKVKKTRTCWEWTAKKVYGYGYLGLNGKSIRAHRFSWELANGKIPPELFVLHKCDNRKCVKPSHLFLGTQKDNIQDAISKNRPVGLSIKQQIAKGITPISNGG